MTHLFSKIDVTTEMCSCRRLCVFVCVCAIDELPVTERNPAVLWDCVSYSSTKTNSHKHGTHRGDMYFFLSLSPLLLFHFLLVILPLFAAQWSLHLSHFPSLSSPGVCLSFLESVFFFLFFSPILCKSSLFLLPSVDSPPDSYKTAQGDFRGLKTQNSLHYASSTGELKRKWRADAPLKWTPPGGSSACVACRKPASL